MDDDDESKNTPSLPTSIYLRADGSPMQVKTVKNGEDIVEMSNELEAPPENEVTTTIKGEIIVDEPLPLESFHTPKIDEPKHTLGEIVLEEAHEGQTFIKIKGLPEKKEKSLMNFFF